MAAHASSVAVQEQACMALKIFVTEEQNNHNNRVKAGSVGAIEAVVAAIKAHSDNARLLTSGCWVLVNLTVGIDANRERAVVAGAVDVVMAALLAPQPGNAALVTETVMDAFFALRQDESDQMDYGAWVYEEAIIKHKGLDMDEDLHEKNALFIEISRKLIDIGIAAFRAKVVNNENALRWACATFMIGCNDFQSQQRYARDAGAVELLNEAVAKFPERKDDVEYVIDYIKRRHNYNE
jgi:hypothetical protein